MSADTSSSAGLSSCWDLRVPQHLSSASQQRMQRRTWGRTQHVERAVVPGGWCWGWARALTELCCERCSGECWLSAASSVTLPMSLKIHLTQRVTEQGRGTKVQKSSVKERTSALTLTTLSLGLFLVVDLQVGLNVKYSVLDSPDLVFLVTLC